MINTYFQRRLPTYSLPLLIVCCIALLMSLVFREFQHHQFLQSVHTINKQDSDVNTELLVNTFGEEALLKSDLKQWAKQNWSLYSLSDKALVIAIEQLCPQFTAANNPAYEGYIKTCNKHPLVNQLKVAAQKQQHIFQPANRLARASVPPVEYQPKNGYAHTCFNSRWDGKSLVLSSSINKDPLMVVARGAYVCPTHLKHPDLQLNQEQFEFLFTDYEYQSQWLYVQQTTAPKSVTDEQAQVKFTF